MADTHTLHRHTPDVIVSGMTGPLRNLRFLRHPDEESSPARLLVSRTVTTPASRTVTLYGARTLMREGVQVADATGVSSLSGQPLRQHTADGDASHALSDSAGRPLWQRNAQGAVTTFTYEESALPGRLLAVHEHPFDGARRVRETLAYGPAGRTDDNLAGQLTEHHHNAGCTRITSIALCGQPLASEEHLLPADIGLPDWGAETPPRTEAPLTLSAVYDASGALLRQTNAAGVCTLHHYGVDGARRESWLRHQAKGEEREQCVVRDIVYTADGRLRSQTRGNGVTEVYEYDPRSLWLTRHTLARPAGHPLGALCLSDLHYHYDPVGNIVRMEDRGCDPQWHGNGTASGQRDYTYDTLYRLASASGRERQPASRKRTLPAALTDGSSGSVWKPYRERYRYDEGDNLTQTEHRCEGNNWTRRLAVSASSNRGGLQADGGGSFTVADGAFYPGGLQKQLPDGRRLRWYADNQLQGVSAVVRDGEEDDTECYHYRDGGNRVRKIRTTRVKGGVRQTVSTYAGGIERHESRPGEKGTTQRDVMISEADGIRLLEERCAGELHYRYHFSDHLGSVGMETDEAGNITSREDYAPYGGTVGADEEAQEVADRTMRYSGKERDATGLYYYGWRYYQPELGRWLSADPGGLIDGMNLFRMCRNNPINIIDTDGRGASGSKAKSKQSQQGGGSSWRFNKREIVNLGVKNLSDHAYHSHDETTGEFNFHWNDDASEEKFKSIFIRELRDNCVTLFRYSDVEYEIKEEFLKQYQATLSSEEINKYERIKVNLARQERKNKKQAEERNAAMAPWRGLSAVWALNSGYAEIQKSSSRNISVSKIISELKSINSGDRNWGNGPYGSEMIGSLYSLGNKTYKQIGDEMEHFLQQHQTTTTQTLYRGVSEAEFAAWERGEYTATGRFVPFSSSKAIAERFGNGGMVVLEGGARGLNIHNIYQERDESEFLINRGSSFVRTRQQGRTIYVEQRM